MWFGRTLNSCHKNTKITGKKSKITGKNNEKRLFPLFPQHEYEVVIVQLPVNNRGDNKKWEQKRSRIIK
jgi:hypothetical protein